MAEQNFDVSLLQSEFALQLKNNTIFNRADHSALVEIFALVCNDFSKITPNLENTENLKQISLAAGRGFSRKMQELELAFEDVFELGKIIRKSFEKVVFAGAGKGTCSSSDDQLFLGIVSVFFEDFVLGMTKEWLRLEILPYHKKLREANRFILHEKRRYFTIFNRMAEPALIVDQKLRLVENNKAFEVMFGLSGSGHIGQPCYDVIGASDDSARSLEKVLYADGAPDVETELKIHGKTRNVIISGTFLGEINSEFSGGIIIITDITEQKRADKALLESEGKYRSLIENVPDVTWRANQSGNISFMSPNLESICGYTFEEITTWEQKSWFARIHPDDIDLVRNEFGLFFASHMPDGSFLRNLLRESTELLEDSRVVDGKRKYDVKYRFQKKDGGWVWLHDRANHIYKIDGEWHTDGVFRDISDLKKAEEELDNHHFRLAEMVDDRTQELRAANLQLEREVGIRRQAENDLIKLAEKLKKSNDELEKFAHVASHDLKEPLILIIAFSERLVKKYSRDLDNKGQEYLKRIILAAEQMFQFIDGLLELSRVSASSNPFEDISLSDIVDDVIQNIEERIKATQGKIIYGDLGSLVGDKLQIRQLFQNIFVNSLKYKKDNEAPLVEVDSCSSAEGFCEIKIKDNGIGFEQQYVERIFKPLERLHGRKEYDGTGIGLATCQKIVVRHGGEITAKSAPGCGTTFIIKLPIKKVKHSDVPQI